MLRDTYTNNKLALVINSLSANNTTRIPRVFHQIWVGPRPLPEKYKRWQKTWQSIPGWTYKLWTDVDVVQFPLINQKAYYEREKLWRAGGYFALRNIISVKAVCI